MRKNMDQEKLRIWTLFKQCILWKNEYWLSTTHTKRHITTSFYILKMLQDIVKVLQLYAAIQTFLSWLFLTIMKWEFFYIREVVLNHKHQMLILVLQWELLETTSIFLQGLYAFIVSDFINAFTGKEKWLLINLWRCIFVSRNI